jgi:hypothetical protein
LCTTWDDDGQRSGRGRDADDLLPTDLYELLDGAENHSIGSATNSDLDTIALVALSDHDEH